jgi:hypothetical protein
MRPSTRAERVDEWTIGGADPAAAVYGLLAIGALMAAESGNHESHLDALLSALIAAFGYWLLHSYARLLGGRIIAGERLTPGLLTHALGRERLLLAGAAVPIAAMLVAWITGGSQEDGITAALWSAVAGLIAFELIAGARSHSSPREFALEIGVGLVLGLAILLLRAVLH